MNVPTIYYKGKDYLARHAKGGLVAAFIKGLWHHFQYIEGQGWYLVEKKNSFEPEDVPTEEETISIRERIADLYRLLD